jgi:regulation of enolase protein 1 (concanavalin A-like superfamily)
VQPTPDGGYFIAGVTEKTPGDSDIYLVKTNGTGDTLWTKTYGGIRPDYPHTLLPLPDGNYFVVGFTKSFGAGQGDVWLIKVDPNGNYIWDKTYGGAGDDEGHEIIPTNDGNYMIAARINTQAALIKVNGSGNVIWTKTYGGPQYETGTSVKQALDGGYILLGTTFTYGAGRGDCWLVKTNSYGDSAWSRTFGGSAFDEGKFVLANTDGSFIFCMNDSSNTNGDIDVRVIKVTGSGALLWSKNYGGDKKEVCKMIQHTMDGGYIVTAISRSFGWINPDFWLVKLDAVGDTMWTRHYGSWDHEHNYAVKQMADGSYIAIGHTKSYSNHTEIMFLKLDLQGTMTASGELVLDENTLNVYPNPTSGMVKIDLEAMQGFSSLRVCNALGQEIYTETLDGSQQEMSRTINLGGKEPGIYFAIFRSAQGLVTKKIILE